MENVNVNVNVNNRQVFLDDTDPVDQLRFEPLDSRYYKVRTLNISLYYIFLIGASALVFFSDWQQKPAAFIIAASIFAIAMTVNLLLVGKICRIRGYALRQHDISYRKGLFFTTITTVPLEKIQQVSIRQTPFSRLVGLYAIDICNGAQGSGSDITIPGLTKERAEMLKSVLIKNDSHDCI